MKKLIYFATLTVLATIFLAGCRSARQPVAPGVIPSADAVAMLKDSYVPWTYVEVPVRFELKKPKKFSVSGTARMASGEAVLFSFRFFGMEMGSLWLTSDSVQAVLKPMGVYYKADIESFTAASGIGVSDIQDLIMGHVFEVPEGVPFDATFHASVDAEGGAALDSVTVVASGHSPVTVAYGRPEVSPCGPFASSFGADASVRGNEVEFSCRWDVGSAKWNTGRTLSAPRIPEGLKQLSSADLIRIIQKL